MYQTRFYKQLLQVGSLVDPNDMWTHALNHETQAVEKNCLVPRDFDSMGGKASSFQTRNDPSGPFHKV